MHPDIHLSELCSLRVKKESEDHKYLRERNKQTNNNNNLIVLIIDNYINCFFHKHIMG